MKKLLFSSLLLFGLVNTGCRQTAREMEAEHVDTPIFVGADTLAPPDRVVYDIDTPETPFPDGVPSKNGQGSPKRPNGKPKEMPKPGTQSEVDSIKNSYPPKK